MKKTISFSLVSLILINSFYLAFLPRRAEAISYGAEFQWSQVIGGSGDEYAEEIHTDSDSPGYIYTLGSVGTTTDFDEMNVVSGDTKSPGDTQRNGFVAKYDTDGTLSWVKIISSTAYNYTDSVDVDSSGNVYVSGIFQATTDFDDDAVIAGDTKVSSGGSDAYIAKYNSSGVLQWVKTFGSSTNESATSIQVDDSGNIFLAGSISSTSTVDFDEDNVVSGDTHTCAGQYDAFIVKYNSSGVLQWAKTMGGSNWEQSEHMRLGSDGYLYLVGDITGTSVDFDEENVVSGDTKSATGGQDVFLAKYSSSTGLLQWVKVYGGANWDSGYTLEIDASNNVLVVGELGDGSADFDRDAVIPGDTQSGNDSDAYVAKYNSSGVFQWAKVVGGSGYDAAWGVDSNSSGEVFFSGSFEETGVDFDRDNSISGDTIDSNNGDFFLAKYTSSGVLRWVKGLGGSGWEESYGMAAYGNDVYLSGYYEDSTVDLDEDFVVAGDTQAAVGSDAFYAKYTEFIAASITGLSGSLAALDTSSGLPATTESGEIGTAGRNIRLSTDGGEVVAEVTTDLTEDRNWATVSADSDTTLGKSFVHNLASAPGTDSTFALFVPKLDNHHAVRVCPGATSLGEVTDSCASGVVYYIEDPEVSIVNISGQLYWKIDGLTGTGGLGIAGNTPNMRVDLANETAGATDDVEVWFDTPTDIIADSLIYIIYDSLFTGGSSLTASDITLNCDADGLAGGTTTGMTSFSLNDAENGYLVIDTNTDACSNWIQVDINGGGGNHLTNPGSPGNYSWAVLTDVSGDGTDDDSGAVLAYVGDDNDVNITATVPPTIDMELFQQGADTELTDTNTCALGVLSLNQVNLCVYDLGTGTNNASGVSVYMTSDGSLDDGNGNSIGSPTGAVTSGEEEYGFYLSELGGGEYSAAGSYGTQHQAVPTSATLLATTNTTGSGTTVGSSVQHLEITHAASMSTSTIVGSYNQVVTYTAYTN